MTYYIKTTYKASAIEPILKYYLNLSYNYYIIPVKLEQYILQNYKLNINYIISKMIRNTRVIKDKNNIAYIYLEDCKINQYSLNTLIKLLEYGNRDVANINLISNMFNRALTMTQNYLGGN